MRSIAIFTSALFYFAATAVALQPGKVELHGVPRNAVAFRTLQKGKRDKPNLKGLDSLVKTEKIKVKKDFNDSDRRLAQKGSIRGGNKKDSIQRERSLQGLNNKIAFAADVSMPVQLQGMSEKASGGSNRRLEDTPCNTNADGSLTCRWEDYPKEGFHIVVSCPASATALSDCSTCAIASDYNADECSSCVICSDTFAAFDCSNIDEDECAIVDCDGNCQESTTKPTESCDAANQCTSDADCCEGYICTFYADWDEPICLEKNPDGLCGETKCMKDADCCEGYYCGYYEGVSVAFCIQKWW